MVIDYNITILKNYVNLNKSWLLTNLKNKPIKCQYYENY